MGKCDGQAYEGPLYFSDHVKSLFTLLLTLTF